MEASGIELRIAIVNLADSRTRYVDQRGRFVNNGELVPLRRPAGVSVDSDRLPTDDTAGWPLRQRRGARERADPDRRRSQRQFRHRDPGVPGVYVAGRFLHRGPARHRRAQRRGVVDEVLQADIAPRGFRAPLTIIAPDVEPYRLFTVDPGLIRIAMDYGYIRAFDEMHANVSVRGALRDLSNRIFRTRKLVWGPLEHRSEGRVDEAGNRWVQDRGHHASTVGGLIA